MCIYICDVDIEGLIRYAQVTTNYSKCLWLVQFSGREEHNW